MKPCLLLVGIFALSLVNADSFGAFRKRFSGNPVPGLAIPEENYRTGLDIHQDINDAPASCCKPIFRSSQPYPPNPQSYPPNPQSYPNSQPYPTNSQQPSHPNPQPYPNPNPQPGPQPQPNPPMPNLPPPVRPTLYIQTEGYRVFDRHHNRELALFDPEHWVRTYPGQSFPSDLDVPSRWYVYNAVTVQAPKPYVDERALRERIYTGYYYACPEKVSPYKFSWMMKNDPVNPCKWIFYQSVKDAGRPVVY